MKEEKVSRYIFDDLEISSDDPDEEAFDESDESDNSDEEAPDKEEDKKWILMVMLLYL